MKSAIEAWNLRQRDPGARIQLTRLPHEDEIVTFTQARGHQVRARALGHAAEPGRSWAGRGLEGLGGGLRA